jgi:hypothetical protein
MPHSEALRHLLQITERQLAEIEAHLLETLSEEETRKAREKAAGLRMKRDELVVLLKGSWEENS